ncbi:MAG: cytochrome P450 [Thermoanaerobaculia bacterium]
MTIEERQADAPTRLVQPIPRRHQADPYPWYEELRAAGPVQRIGERLWIATGYEAVAAALRDRRLGRANSSAWRPSGPFWLEELRARAATASGRTETLGLSKLWMINLDLPEHPPLRRAVGRELGASAVERLRPRVVELCRELLEDLHAQTAAPGEFDLMERFALPLPALVVAELLGIPASDRAATIALARTLGPALAGEADESGVEVASAATISLAEYFRDILRSAAGPPPESLLAHFAAAGLDEPHAVAQAILLFFAGEETTANWIGNGFDALLRAPRLYQALAGATAEERGGHDPAFRAGLEELLRFDSPVQFTLRLCLEPLTLAGGEIAAGDYLVVGLAAANRDPAVFARPDSIDLGRRPNPHLAFGSGLHSCLGAALARLEAEEAFAAVLRRFPNLERGAAPPARQPGGLLRGLAVLPVRAGSVNSPQGSAR